VEAPLKTVCALLLSAALLSGCEVVRSGQVASELEREAARDLVAQLTAIAAQPVDAPSILEAASFMPLVTLVAPPGTPVPVLAGNASDPGDCLLATSTSATYSQCEIADHVIDGTWSAQLSRVRAEFVDVFVVGPGVHGAVTIEANLSAGNEISGQLEAGLTWSAGPGDHVLDATMRIEGLVIEGPRCATAGTIVISTTLGTSSGAPGATLGDAPTTTTLWFGPGCQDVLIAR
jgi:hypothetical protein